MTSGRRRAVSEENPPFRTGDTAIVLRPTPPILVITLSANVLERAGTGRDRLVWAADESSF